MKASFDFFGSVYSRNPHTGTKEIFGHLYSFDKETTVEVHELDKTIYSKIKRILRRLERRMHFVSEAFILYGAKKGELEIRFKKKAKIGSSAYPRVLLDLLDEGIITEKELLQNLPLEISKEWMASHALSGNRIKPLCAGEAISFGAGSGKVLKGRESVENALLFGEKVIWVMENVTSEDLKIFSQLQGVVLTKSGPTSHASVVAKALGIPAILGCKELLKNKYEGKVITVDANNGKVFSGKLGIVEARTDERLQRVLNIAKRHSKVKIVANADTALDAKRAIEFGVYGIGLCRTEHMFFGKDKANLIRQILFVDNPSEKSLEELKKLQEKDFCELFEVEKGNEVVVRYLDAPLHEFAGNPRDNMEENPMLGMRGARMLLKKPEIIKIQTRAIFSALLKLHSKGKKVKVGLEIPLIMDASELRMFKSLVNEEINALDPRNTIEYEFGAMIEVPRAAFLIEEIAKEADFISFGTNDLTQMMLGLSRDDSGSFLDYYVEKRLLSSNPFVSLDKSGVGKLVEETSNRAKKANKRIKISACGEQASDPESIKNLLRYEVDTLSCSPSRIPIALVASGKYGVS